MKTITNHVMGREDWLLLVFLSVLWGGSFFFAKVALRDVPPLTFVLGRVALAALALNVVVRLSGAGLPSGGVAWRDFFTMGALNNVLPFALLSWALTEIPSGLGAILNAATPLFTVLVAHWLTADERVTPARLAGILVGLAGVAVLVGLDAASGLGRHILADLAAIGATILYAFAGIFGRRFRGRPPLVTAAGQLTASTIMALPVVLLIDRPWALPLPGIATWSAMVGAALLSTALGYVIYFRVLATAGATNLLLVTFLMPVSALLLGMLFLGEHLALSHFLGMVLIGLGLAAIDGRPLAYLRLPAPRVKSG